MDEGSSEKSDMSTVPSNDLPSTSTLGDFFEVMDVLVKEEKEEAHDPSSDFDVIEIEDVSSLPEPVVISTSASQVETASNDGPQTSGQDAQLSGSGVSSSYQCTKCWKTFTDVRRLRRHDRSVHALFRVQCEMCNYSTARKDHLQRHYQCWHKEECRLSYSFWKRATQKNKAKAKMLLRPDAARKKSKQKSAKSSMTPKMIRFPLDNRSRSSPVSKQIASGIAPFAEEVPVMWNSLTPVSADVSIALQLPVPSSDPLASSTNPSTKISSVRTLLQPSSMLNLPSRTSLSRSSHLDRMPGLASSLPELVTTVQSAMSLPPVSRVSPRSAAAVASSSPQIVSLLQSASPPGIHGNDSLPTITSRSNPALHSQSAPTSSNSQPSLTSSILSSSASTAASGRRSSGSPDASVPLSMSPRSRQHHPVASTCTVSVLDSRPATCAGNSSSHIFNLLQNKSKVPASSILNRAGARNPPSIGRVQARVSQNQSENQFQNQSHNQPRNQAQSPNHSLNTSNPVSSSSLESSTRNEGTKWATVEEKKIVRYFVEGRLIRQQEESVQCYRKIPEHWDHGIDIRQNVDIPDI